MATYAPSPGPFKAKDADPEATLEIFEDYLENMTRVFMLSRRINPATGAKIEFDDAEKKAMLIVEGGQDMNDLFKHVGKVLPGDTYEAATAKIIQGLKRRGNRTSAVFKLFNSHAQGKQSFDAWHKEVYKAAKLIDWTDYGADQAAVDAIVMQTSSVKLQQRAIQDNPSYDQLVNLGISQEQAKKKANSLPDGEEDVINRLQEEMAKLKGQLQQPKKANQGKCNKCLNTKCKDPGGAGCWAANISCFNCGQTGHVKASKLCSGQKKKKVKTGKIQVAEESGSESETSSRIVEERAAKVQGAAQKNSIVTEVGMKAWDPEGDTEEVKIKVDTDTGVRKTILNRKDWFKIKDDALLVKTKIRFRPYGTKEHLPIRGRAKVQLRAKAGATIVTHVYIMDDETETSLLGKRDAQRLGIVKINLKGEKEEVNLDGEVEAEECHRIKFSKKESLISERMAVDEAKVQQEMCKIQEEFADIMSGGIGMYNGDPVKIQMAEGVTPVIQPPRRVPLHYVQPLKDHLDEMLREDVIEGPLKEEEEGSWIANLVITDKRWDEAEKEVGERVQIRANLDCRPLNKHVYQTHEPIPTPEELRHNLHGSNRFSILDMNHSFHQFKIEEPAKKLFTFRTPWGLYRYKRLVMGNSPASSECHRRVRTVLQGCEGVAQIKDDVLVYGTGEEHDQRLRLVLQRFREAGLTLRKEKCQLGRHEVKWFGMIFSEEGMVADPAKTEVIKRWPRPRTVRDVKSFLQTVQFNSVYMGAELPGEMNYPELTEPLRELTRRGKKFTWTDQHQQHFELIKERLCSDRVMVPFDPARETKLYADGGPQGCQATVVQAHMHSKEGLQWRPVAHTSRAWTGAEKRYSQIEKESNALHSGIVSNKMYLLGRSFVAAVDHKPLLPLYNTARRPKQMRVDRHRMKLAGYDFKVEHVAGTEMPCDYGSRRGCPEAREYSAAEMEEWGVEEDDEIFVNRVMEEQLPPAITKDVLREAIAQDDTMQMLMEDIEAGLGYCRPGLVGFKNVFEELYVVDGLIVRGAQQQLIIPKELQPAAVQLAHEGHLLGEDKTLGLLRETCWFPGMAKMVKEYVESCVTCMAALPGTGQEPMKPTPLPDRPWQHIHADFKGPIGNKYYLHTFIDQYTKYPVVDVCTSTSWEQMEPMLERALGMLGNVESVTTDNGPPYNSENFRKFSQRMGFKHRRCTPVNPQANGLVEVFQKVLVKLVHTAIIDQKDPRQVVQAYLRAYRAAPHRSTGKSPYEALFNRKMVTKLPGLGQRAGADFDKQLRDTHSMAKLKQKQYSDKRRQVKRKEVQPGDRVLLKREKSTIKSPWDPQPYKVVQVEGSKVTTQRGEEKKARAKNHIKVVKERPVYLQVKGWQQFQKKEDTDLDLEVSPETIERMGAPLGVQAGPDHGVAPAAAVVGADHGADAVGVQLQEEVAAQLQDRSISTYGRVRREPVRLGVEKERVNTHLETEVLLTPEAKVMRERSPVAPQEDSPDGNLMVQVVPVGEVSTPDTSPDSSLVLPIKEASWLPLGGVCQGRTARERAQDILERHRHWSHSGEGVPDHARFEGWIVPRQPLNEVRLESGRQSMSVEHQDSAGCVVEEVELQEEQLTPRENLSPRRRRRLQSAAKFRRRL